MGPKAPVSHGSLSPRGCPRGLGVLIATLPARNRRSYRFSLGLAQFGDSAVSQVSSLLALMALIGFAVVEVATRVFT